LAPRRVQHSGASVAPHSVLRIFVLKVQWGREVVEEDRTSFGARTGSDGPTTEDGGGTESGCGPHSRVVLLHVDVGRMDQLRRGSHRQDRYDGQDRTAIDRVDSQGQPPRQWSSRVQGATSQLRTCMSLRKALWEVL
jgi:hypothetical protein